MMIEYQPTWTEPEYDDALDRLVDSGVYSYAMARVALGWPPYTIVDAHELADSPLGHDDMVDDALESYDVSTEPGAVYNPELSPYVPYTPKTDAQMQVDQRGREYVRRAMADVA